MSCSSKNPTDSHSAKAYHGKGEGTSNFGEEPGSGV